MIDPISEKMAQKVLERGKVVTDTLEVVDKAVVNLLLRAQKSKSRKELHSEEKFGKDLENSLECTFKPKLDTSNFKSKKLSLRGMIFILVYHL